MVAIAAPLRPLATLAWGMLLVVLDLRYEGIDLVPDPLGWAMGAVACGSLSRSVAALPPEARRWFGVTSVACAVAALPAVAEWAGVQHPVVTTAISVAETVVVFVTCTAIMAALPACRATANAVRWSDLGTSAVVLVLVAGATAEPELAPLALFAGLAALAVFVWFLVLLFQAAKEPAADL